MDAGIAVLSQEKAPIPYAELIKREKEFFLKRRAECAQGTRKTYGSADIDAEAIEMMELEASELEKLGKNRIVAFQEGGSDFEGWLTRALDRVNRYKKWLKKQKGEVSVTEKPKALAPQTQALHDVSELMNIEKDFFLKRQAEFEQGNKKWYGPADIDADEIVLMELEATAITKLLKQDVACIQEGSDYEGWICRALDRRSRHENWLKKQAEQKREEAKTDSK